MPGDLQVFKVVDVLPARIVHERQVEEDRILRVFLRNGTLYVSEVTLNGHIVPSFSFVGGHYLDLVIPFHLQSYSLDELDPVVLSSQRTENQDLYEILYGLGRISASIAGHDVLIQRWVRYLLMTPGSDPYDRSAGVGLMRLAGQVLQSDPASARAEVARMHTECVSQIVQRQFSFRTRRKPKELLMTADLVGVGIDEGGRLIISSVLVDGRRQAIGSTVRV